MHWETKKKLCDFVVIFAVLWWSETKHKISLSDICIVYI